MLRAERQQQQLASLRLVGPAEVGVAAGLSQRAEQLLERCCVFAVSGTLLCTVWDGAVHFVVEVQVPFCSANGGSPANFGNRSRL